MNYRAKIIRIATFLGGIYFFLKFVLPKQIDLPWIGPFELGAYNDPIGTGLLALACMAVGLGLVNLLLGHGSTIVFRRKGWINSVALLLGLFIMLYLSFSDWGATLSISHRSEKFFVLRDFSARIQDDVKNKVTGVLPVETRNQKLVEAVKVLMKDADPEIRAGLSSEDSVLKASAFELNDAIQKLSVQLESVASSNEGNEFKGNQAVEPLLSQVGSGLNEMLTRKYAKTELKGIYNLFFQGLFVSLGSAMFSLLGFYIASAAYRAFRIKSLESALMMCAALLVMLGQIPFMLFGSGPFGESLHHLFPQIRLWLLTVPNTAAFRAIELGSGIAGLILAFRMWLSIESSSFSMKEGKK